mgnify:FL=1
MATFLPSVYAFFAAAAAGCLLATVFGELRRVGTDRLTAVTLSALVATLAAAAAVVGQFGRPALLFSVFSNPGTAIFRELASLLLALLAGAAYLASLRTGATRRTGRKLSLLAAASGLILALAVGSAAVQPWRPVWNTWTLVLPTAGFAWLAGVMLAKSLGAAGHESAGPALSVLRKAEEKTGETASEPLWESTRLAALAPLVGLACYFAAASTDASARTALASLLTGANAWLFWAGVIVPSVLLSFLAAQFASDTLKRNPVLGIALATLSAFAAGAWQHLVLGLA